MPSTKSCPAAASASPANVAMGDVPGPAMGFGRVTAAFLGLDHATALAVTSKILQAAGAAALLVLVGYVLPARDKGLYFAFASFLSATTFFELGIGLVVLQHSARLTGVDGTKVHDLEGERADRARNLYSFGVIWNGGASVLCLLLICPVGYSMIHGAPDTGAPRDWLGPWLAQSLAASLLLLANGLVSFYEGGGYQKSVLRLRAVQASVAYALAIAGLLAGAGIWVGTILLASQLACSAGWISALEHRRRHAFFSSLTARNFGAMFRELWPLQWRIAASWISGFFVFQSVTILVLREYGPKAAGEVGFAITAASMLTAFVASWISTKIPLFVSLAAEGDIGALHAAFVRTFAKATAVFTAAAIMAIAIGIVALARHPMENIDRTSIALIAAASIANFFVCSMSAYLRAFFADPLMWPSIGYAVVTVAGVFAMMPIHGAKGAIEGYVFASVLNCLVCAIVFLSAWNARLQK